MHTKTCTAPSLLSFTWKQLKTRCIPRMQTLLWLLTLPYKYKGINAASSDISDCILHRCEFISFRDITICSAFHDLWPWPVTLIWVSVNVTWYSLLLSYVVVHQIKYLSYGQFSEIWNNIIGRQWNDFFLKFIFNHSKGIIKQHSKFQVDHAS